MIRVSTDPQDPAYIDARPRKAWVNGVRIEGWTVADEFRRVVQTPAGNIHGAVSIERLPDEATAPQQKVRFREWTLEEHKSGAATHLEPDVIVTAEQHKAMSPSAPIISPVVGDVRQYGKAKHRK